MRPHVARMSDNVVCYLVFAKYIFNFIRRRSMQQQKRIHERERETEKRITTKKTKISKKTTY